MGHDIGVSKSYYKPSEKEILGDYVKAVRILSVHNTSNIELENRVKELTEKQDEIEFIKSKYEREIYMGKKSQVNHGLFAIPGKR